MSDQKRRNFLKLGLIGAAIGLVKPFKAGELVAQSFEAKIDGPIVISTWNHGLAANAAAWEVLRVGGNAIDAECGKRCKKLQERNWGIIGGVSAFIILIIVIAVVFRKG